MTHFASRLAGIEPFQVMDILARPARSEAQGRSIIHMEIGEPDFPAAPGIVAAGIAALKAGHTHYTPALGLPALRAAIAANYAPACHVSAARVVVTPGASGALQLVLAALLDPGDQVLMADPGYPCNRHFVRLFEGAAVSTSPLGRRPIISSTPNSFANAGRREPWRCCWRRRRTPPARWCRRRSWRASLRPCASWVAY